MLETRDARRGTRQDAQRFSSRLVSYVSRLMFSCAVAVSAASPVVALADAPIPPLTSPVTDLTGTLTPTQIQSLDQTLRAFEARKGSQVAVLIVPTTQGESIEQYSMRVVESWKLGRKGVDDGALLIIAKNDRALRIEVGYGLEGVLTDALSNRINRNIITPQFRAGEFYLGIVAGTDAIMRAIDGEPLPEPTLTERARRPGSDIGSILPILLIAGVVVGGILRAIFGRLGGASLAAVGAGFIVWLVVGTVVVAILAAMIAFFITLLSGGQRGFRGGRGWHGGGIGGGWGGGMGGGGGWSGGGGGFGGGGASGRW